jgi:two-component system sensor kinase FixL
MADAQTPCAIVEDTGEGVAPEIVDRLFDAFVTTKPHGMGLGLAICSTIVEAHGGTIAVSRGSLGGAVFEVKLPLGEDEL